MDDFHVIIKVNLYVLPGKLSLILVILHHQSYIHYYYLNHYICVLQIFAATVTAKFCVVAECGACKYENPFNAVVVVTPELLIASASKVPSKYKCLHCCDAAPKSKVSSSSGTRLEANSPPTTISSVDESPSLIVPPRNVTIPINSDSPLTNNLSVIETAAPTVTSLLYTNTTFNY